MSRLRSLAARGHAVLLAVLRWRFLTRVALSGRLAGADLDVRVHPSARIGRRIRVRVAHGARGSLHIGANTHIGDDVEIRLADGGALLVGEWVEVRRGAAFMVGGRVELVGENLLSWGVVVHCDEHVRLGHHATVGEYVTIADSAHAHQREGWHLDTIVTAPVHIGVDTWIGAKATVTKGVTVGDRCVVAAGAVVTRDVPDDHIALGVPAAVRPRTGAPPPG